MVTLVLAGQDLSVISMIGIVKKNAIVMVNVALETKVAGAANAVEAIRHASQALTLFTTPVVFLYLNRVAGHERSRLSMSISAPGASLS